MTLLHALSTPKPCNMPLNPARRFQPRPKPLLSFSVSASSSSQNPEPTPKSRRRSRKPETPPESCGSPDDSFPSTIPRKPRRGRRSEKVAVEDFVRDSLERTFASIRKQNSEVLDGEDEVLKREKVEKRSDNDDDDEEEEEEEEEEDGGNREKVVEEDDPHWPVDAEVGWGTRASEYFEKYPIKNVIVDGMEIDWEGELEDNWVKEINCLEWEKFAFHPSPLIVLVFERYNRAADNWNLLKELEKAIKVYWGAKDHLPPRTVKLDINIERDLAYALQVRECPQVLFLWGHTILYREKAFRTADELVKMIAFFYYNAKKPSWIDDAALAPPYQMF